MSDRLADLRKYMALMQLSLNKAFGVDLGKKSEISPNGITIIYTCYFFRMRMKDLAALSNVSKSTVTEYVDTLEKKGFVRRVRGDTDRRDIYIEPTEKAGEWVRETERKIYAYMRDSLERLTPEEQEQFIGLFNKFVGDLNTIPYEKLFEKTMKSDFGGHETK
jgi:DNA-binding MarR family transcriptional regulator